MNPHFNRARRGQLDAAGPIDKQAGSTGLSRYQFLIARCQAEPEPFWQISDTSRC